MSNFIYRSCEFRKVGDNFLQCPQISDSFFSTEEKATADSIQFFSYLQRNGLVNSFKIYDKPLRFEYQTILGEYVDTNYLVSYFGVRKHVVL